MPKFEAVKFPSDVAENLWFVGEAYVPGPVKYTPAPAWHVPGGGILSADEILREACTPIYRVGHPLSVFHSEAAARAAAESENARAARPEPKPLVKARSGGLSFQKRQVLAMCESARHECGGRPVPFWELGTKNTLRALEKAGLVEIERTRVLVAGLREWRARITDAGVSALRRLAGEAA